MKTITMNAATVSTNSWHYTRQDIEKLVAESLQKAADAHDEYDCREYLDHIEYEEGDYDGDDSYEWYITVYTKESSDIAGVIATNIARYDTDCWDWFVSSIRTAEVEVDDKPLNIDEYNKQVEIDKAIEQANGELAECIEMIHNCKSLEEVYDFAKSNGLMSFGSADRPDGDVLDINYKSICLTVCTCEEGIYVSDYVEVYDKEGDRLYIGTFDEQGATGVKSQVGGRIYLKPDEPEQSTDDEEDVVLESYDLDNSDDEYCYLVNDYFYLHVVVDAEYDQWSYALYNNKYELLLKDWSCGIDCETWESVLKNEITERIGKKIYSILPHSAKLFKHLKNA